MCVSFQNDQMRILNLKRILLFSKLKYVVFAFVLSFLIVIVILTEHTDHPCNIGHVQQYGYDKRDIVPRDVIGMKSLRIYQRLAMTERNSLLIRKMIEQNRDLFHYTKDLKTTNSKSQSLPSCDSEVFYKRKYKIFNLL